MLDINHCMLIHSGIFNFHLVQAITIEVGSLVWPKLKKFIMHTTILFPTETNHHFGDNLGITAASPSLVYFLLHNSTAYSPFFYVFIIPFRKKIDFSEWQIKIKYFTVNLCCTHHYSNGWFPFGVWNYPILYNDLSEFISMIT